MLGPPYVLILRAWQSCGELSNATLMSLLDMILLVALLGLGQLHLNTVDTIDAINEEDQDEDECNLPRGVSMSRSSCSLVELTFIPYCSFAIMGLSDMKVKSFRFIVYGKGTMSSPKTDISNTKRANT